MIIKSIHINAFGGIKNYHLKFIKGMNLIYGENEAGKSTIQNFVKIWLYGFSNYHGKNIIYNERLKYTPLNGEKINGALTFEIDKREYTIIRSFGKTKKDDEIKVIDSLTGEDLSDIYGDEPGEKILAVNRSTFIKTLFIGQLAVEIKRDNDEKIFDKIINFTASNDDEVTVQKSFEKINQYIKSITNIRKNGTLDVAREKRGLLEIEKIEYYKTHENNMTKEEKLLLLKKHQSVLNKKASNLLMYKKYLQIEELKNKYGIFKNKEIQFYSYKDKINKLQKEINNLEYKKQQLQKNIDNSIIIENMDDNLKNIFVTYEHKLNELKNIYADTQVLNYRKKYIGIFLLLLNVLIIINFKYKIIIISLDFCIALAYIYNKFFNEKSLNYKFYRLSKEIKTIENNLDNMQQLFGTEDYEDLFKKINIYYKNKNYKKIIEEKINEKKEEIKLLQMKLQLVGNIESPEEKMYLEKKINEIKSSHSNLWDEQVINNFKKTINMNSDFNKLTILEKKEKIEKEIDTNNMNLLNCEKEIITLENNIKSSFYGKRSLAEIEEDIINIDYQIDDFKKKLKAGELAREMMKKSYLEIRDDFGPELNEKLLKKYNAICNKEYNNILVSDEYEMNLIKDSSLLDYKLLSNGAKDQLFLALRLSFIEMIFNKKDITIFLDDAFIQYDDNKLKNVLNLLLKEDYGQQIIFTCQHREKKVFEDLTVDFNYIVLD